MEERPSTTLRRLINGYQVSQAIHVAATRGKERTLEEFAALFADSGFRLEGGTPTAALNVIEGLPA